MMTINTKLLFFYILSKHSTLFKTIFTELCYDYKINKETKQKQFLNVLSQTMSAISLSPTAACIKWFIFLFCASCTFVSNRLSKLLFTNSPLSYAQIYIGTCMYHGAYCMLYRVLWYIFCTFVCEKTSRA